jgi:uncharacterized protein YjdB
LAPFCFGCSGHTAGPTTPSQSVAVSITPNTTVLSVGDIVQFSVSTDGAAGVPATGPRPEWSTTDAAVLVVDASGQARGVGPGTATLTVRYLGRIDSRLLHVVP